MARKVPKTLSIDLELAQRLEEEDNQSTTVEKALRNHWGIDEKGEGDDG